MMCGILCLYNQQRNVLDDCGKFNKMLHLLDHRGPDDMRTYFDCNVFMKMYAQIKWKNFQ